MQRLTRAVGYCLNEECEDHARGVFLLGHESKFYCVCCRKLGLMERETGTYSGEGDYFNEVRVEFLFDPIEGAYKGVAIVKDETLPQCKVYTLRSPLIRTDKRALKVAESTLGSLALTPALDDGIPKTQETILNLDDPMPVFVQGLNELSARWQGSTLCTKGFGQGADKATDEGE